MTIHEATYDELNRMSRSELSRTVIVLSREAVRLRSLTENASAMTQDYGQVCRLRARIEEQDAEIARLRLENDGLRNSLQEKSMSLLEKEGIIKEQASVITENRNLSKEMELQFSQMKDETRGLRSENLELKKEVSILTEKVDLLRKRQFGKKSEKQGNADTSSVDPLDDEVREEQMPETPDHESPKKACGNDQDRKGKNPEKTMHSGRKKGRGCHKTKGKRKRDLSSLPHHTDYVIDEGSFDREYGYGNWAVCSWNHTQELKCMHIYYVHDIYTPNLSVGLEHIMVYIRPEKLLANSLVSASLATDVLFQRFVLATTYYRLESYYSMQGLSLSRQTLCNWTMRLATELFGPVYQGLAALEKVELHNQVDETTVNVLENGSAVNYMWVHVTSELSLCHPIVVFCFEESRRTDHLRNYYGHDSEHVITSDGYVSYDVFEEEEEGVQNSKCLGHCRRKFNDALVLLNLRGMPEEDRKDIPEVKVLHLIGEIYHEENKLRDVSLEERLAGRQQNVKPKFDALFSYIHSLDPDDPGFSDTMAKAIRYAINQEAKLRLFLEDPEIPIDNNRAERAIRPFTIGRKNWMFCDSLDGAAVCAIMYSIIETAKCNGANVYLYLKYILETMPTHLKGTDYSGYLADMYPWSGAFKEYVRKEMDRKQHFSLDGFFDNGALDQPTYNRKGKKKRCRF